MNARELEDQMAGLKRLADILGELDCNYREFHGRMSAAGFASIQDLQLAQISTGKSWTELLPSPPSESGGINL